MPPCPLAHWLQRCRTSQTVAFGVWKSTGMTRDWPSQAMMMATKLKHILTRYALMKPHFIAAFVARGPWPTFIPVLNCCCQGYFVIWNLKTHEAERVLSCISAARRRRASMDGRWKHVFFGPRQSWDDPFGLRRLDQDEDVGGPRRSLVENFWSTDSEDRIL